MKKLTIFLLAVIVALAAYTSSEAQSISGIPRDLKVRDILLSNDGVERLKNGSFTGNATGWTLGNGWAYSANTAAKNAAGTAALEQAVGAQAAEIYSVTYTVSNWTAGTTLTPQIGAANGTAITGNETATTQYILTTGNGNLKFIPTTDVRCKVDTVSVKRVDSWVSRNSAGTVTGYMRGDGVLYSANIGGNLGNMATQSANNVAITGGAINSAIITAANLVNATYSGTYTMGNAAGFRGNLGLANMATQEANNVAIIGGAINSAIITSANIVNATYSGDYTIGNAAGFRGNLALGNIATQNSNNVAITGGAINSAILTSANLVDATFSGTYTIGNAAGFRGNLGLGNIATQSSNNVAITGGAINSANLANATFSGSITEGIVELGTCTNGSVNVAFSDGSIFNAAINGNCAWNAINLATGRSMTLTVSHLANTTNSTWSTVTWGSNNTAPAWSNAVNKIDIMVCTVDVANKPRCSATTGFNP